MANEDYKSDQIVEIVREFDNTGNKYEVNGLELNKMIPFWRKDKGKFYALAKGQYTYQEESSNTFLVIQDETILGQATEFQLVYIYSQDSSKYIEDFPDLTILVDKYNQLVDDTTKLFTYLKNTGIKADTLKMTKVLVQLEPFTVLYMNDAGELEALPVDEMYNKFDSMVNKAYEEVKKLLLADKENMSQELRDETDELLGELNNLDTAIRSEIEKLGNKKIDEIIAEGKKQLEAVQGAGTGLAPRVDGLEKNKLDKGNVSADYDTAEKIETKIKEVAESVDSITINWEDIVNKPTSLPNPYGLILQLNGISQTSYNGSSALRINITASNVGALPIGGGTITGALTVNGKTTTADVQTNGDLVGTSDKAISGFGKVYNPVWG